MATNDTMILEIETLINKGLLEQTDTIVGKIGKTANKTEKSISGMGNAFKSVAGMAAAYLTVGEVMKGIDTASDFTENRNKMEAVFKGQVEDADKFIKEMGESLRLGKGQLEKEMADVGGMLKGMGFEDADLKGNTQAVLKVTKDLASFYNTDLASAVQKVTAGLTGEAEGLKALGINIQDTAMAEYAQSLGYTWTELDNTSKAQLRLNAVMEKMKAAGAAGDAEKTKNEYAAVERSISSLTETIKGEFFMSIKDSLLPVLQQSQDFLINNKDAIVGFGASVGEFIGTVVEGVGVVSDFISENSDLIGILAEVVVIAGSLVGIYKSVVVVTELWATAQAILNGTLLLNPIGLVVAAGAGLIYFLHEAYQNVEPFRNAVNSLFEALKSGWEWLKSSKLGQFFSDFSTGSDAKIKILEEQKAKNIQENTVITKAEEIQTKKDESDYKNEEVLNSVTTQESIKTVKTDYSIGVDVKTDDAVLKNKLDAKIKETIEEHERNKMLNLGLV